MVVTNKSGEIQSVKGLDCDFFSTTFGHFWYTVRSNVDSMPAKFYTRGNSVEFYPNILPSKKIVSAINEENPDVVHLNWISGGMIQLERLTEINAPVVWRLPDMWPFTGGCHFSGECKKYTDKCGSCPKLTSSKELDLSRWTWRRKKKVYDELDPVLVATSEWMKECINNASLTENLDIMVIPNGVNTSQFKPIDQTQARDIFNLPQNKSIVLFGAINPESSRKGYSELIKSLNGLHDRKKDNVEVAAFGNFNKVSDIKFKVNNIGYLHDEQSLAALYSAADVMVVPSRQEPFGQTIIESLSCGTPVVAFNATGPKYIINHNSSGYLAEPFDALDLCDGIEQIITDKELRQTLSEGARKRVKSNFDISTVADEYIELYQSIIK